MDYKTSDYILGTRFSLGECADSHKNNSISFCLVFSHTYFCREEERITLFVWK